LKKINRWLVKLLQALLRALKRNERVYTQKTQVKHKTALKKPTETIGKLFINGESFCDTLENPYINNERNISCIPEGQYKVRLRLPRESATRDYLHLLVQDVPNRN